MARSMVRWLTVSFSLLATPVVVFLSTSNELYLINQADFDYDWRVLLPFLGIAAVTLLIGLLIYATTREPRRLLWAYYSAAPLFVLATLIRDSAVGSVLKLATMALAVGLVGFILTRHARRLNFEVGTQFFALLALLILGHEVLLFGRSVEHLPADPLELENRASTRIDPENRRPNVYHFVFDEFQTDLFELTLTDEVKEELAGFVFFPEATTLFGRTAMSLSTVMTGKNYDFNSAQLQFQKSAFNTDRSILSALKRAGYETRAHMHRVYRFELALFDLVSLHRADSIHLDATRRTPMMFGKLWAFSVLPRSVGKRVLPEEDVQLLEQGGLLLSSAPVVSYYNYRKILDLEGSLGDSNRYLFVHLVIPHFPNVLRSDCSCVAEPERTTPLEQSECATRMILDLVRRLKELGRFESSLLIVQGDHGSRYLLENGELVNQQRKGLFSDEFNRARSRSLLLVKPPGAGSEELRVSPQRATLLDVAPTMFELCELEGDMDFDGVPLIPEGSVPTDRERFYYFYEKKGKAEWTDEMVEYRVDPGPLTRVGVVSLENNPRP